MEIGKHRKSYLFLSLKRRFLNIYHHSTENNNSLWGIFFLKLLHLIFTATVQVVVPSSFHRWNIRPQNVKWLAKNPVACALCTNTQAAYQRERCLNLFSTYKQAFSLTQKATNPQKHLLPSSLSPNFFQSPSSCSSIYQTLLSQHIIPFLSVLPSTHAVQHFIHISFQE